MSRVRGLSLGTGPIPPIVVLTPLALVVGILVPLALIEEAWISLLGLGVLCAAPIVIRWPVYTTFGAYVLFMPFDQVIALPGVGTVNRLFGMLAVAALLTAGLVERRLRKPPLEAVFFGALLLWAIMSMLWALDPDAVVARLPTAVNMIALYLVAVSFRVSNQELRVMCALAVIGGAAAGVVSWLYGAEAYAPQQRQTLAGDEAFADPNFFAASLLLPLALAIAGVIISRTLTARLAAGAAIAITGATIMLTVSRGSLVALTVMLLLLFIGVNARWQILVVIGVVAGLTLVMPEAFFDRIGRLVEGVDSTGSGRTEIWAVGLEMLRDNAILGVGFANFMTSYGVEAHVGPRGGYRGAHNTYLGLWAELGVIGLLVLLTALALHLWRAQRTRRLAGGPAVLLAATQAGCVGTAVAAIFIDVLWKKWFWLPWILLTWAVASTREPRVPDDSEAPDQV
jgi:O-antigen ligase